MTLQKRWICAKSIFLLHIFTARKRSLRRLCQASVCPWGGGGTCVAGGHTWQGGICGREHVWQGCMVGGGHVWQGACMAGGMHGKGHAWQGGVHGKGVCMAVGNAWQAGGVHGRYYKICRYYEIRWYGQWAGSTHPTGMHSCYRWKWLLIEINTSIQSIRLTRGINWILWTTGYLPAQDCDPVCHRQCHSNQQSPDSLVQTTAARHNEVGLLQFPSLSSICQSRKTVAKDFQINTAESNITKTFLYLQLSRGIYCPKQWILSQMNKHEIFRLVNLYRFFSWLWYISWDGWRNKIDDTSAVKGTFISCNDNNWLFCRLCFSRAGNIFTISIESELIKFPSRCSSLSIFNPLVIAVSNSVILLLFSWTFKIVSAAQVRFGILLIPQSFMNNLAKLLNPFRMFRLFRSIWLQDRSR